MNCKVLLYNCFLLIFRQLIGVLYFKFYLPEEMICCRSAAIAGTAVRLPARSTAATILDNCFNIEFLPLMSG